MAEQKLTPEEVNEIKSIQKTQETLLNSFGELEFQIQTLELQKEKLVDFNLLPTGAEFPS